MFVRALSSCEPRILRIAQVTDAEKGNCWNYVSIVSFIAQAQQKQQQQRQHSNVICVYLFNIFIWIQMNWHGTNASHQNYSAVDSLMTSDHFPFVSGKSTEARCRENSKRNSDNMHFVESLCSLVRCDNIFKLTEENELNGENIQGS